MLAVRWEYIVEKACSDQIKDKLTPLAKKDTCLDIK